MLGGARDRLARNPSMKKSQKVINQGRWIIKQIEREETSKNTADSKMQDSKPKRDEVAQNEMAKGQICESYFISTN